MTTILTAARGTRVRGQVPRIGTVLIALLAAACSGDAPAGVRVPTPVASVVDAAHGGSAGFYFRPPLVSEPASTEAADMSALPVVVVCAWTGSACAGIAASFTTTSGSGGEVVRSDGDTGFIVNWDTDQLTIVGATIYRIRVLLGAAELGHADVELVSGGQSLRNADTDAPIALEDGRTLPIRFRITQQAVPPSPPTLSPRDERESVALGATHGCALDVTGHAWCWGSNYFGELGTGSTGASTEVPQAVTGGQVFTSLVAGSGFTCGIDAAGAAWCWGANSDGQLGRGTTTSAEPVPQVVTGGHSFAALSAGSFSVCGRTATGEIWCWGYGLAGSLGNGTYVTSPAPVKVTAPGDPVFTRVDAGAGHVCALDAGGTAWCWGLNDTGQLGRGIITAKEATPAVAVGGQVFAALVAGGRFTCALDAAGAASCWGDNAQGQLGRGTITGAEVAVAPVAGAEPFVRLVAGLQFACGQTVTGTAWCWGANDFGQLGMGVVGPDPDYALPTPQAVLEGANWPVLAGGFFHTCGIAFDGSARCWGNNASKQVGVASPFVVPAHTTVGAMTFALP